MKKQIKIKNAEITFEDNGMGKGRLTFSADVQLPMPTDTKKAEPKKSEKPKPAAKPKATKK